MRIALLHPTYWPEVRRGSERLVHDLGTTLADRGHEVTLLTSHPGRSSSALEDGIRVVRSRRLPQPPTFGLHEDHLGTVPTIGWKLARGDYDIVHAFHPADSWAAVQARRFGGPPVVSSLHGTPTRAHLVSRRYRLEMFQAVVAEAAEVSVLSAFSAEPFERYLLRRPRILPGGVLLDEFAVAEPRAEPPTLLCAASIGDPRKRGRLLLDAFALLRERRPEVRLEVMRTPDPHLSPYTFELPEGARWVEADSTEALARAYARSWASVLTAEEEAFGLVLVESFAAGTPVVAARSGACPEIVSDERVGTLFDGEEPAAAADAIEDCLELAAAETTREACRNRARAYDWRTVVELYEAVYEAAVAAPVGAR